MSPGRRNDDFSINLDPVEWALVAFYGKRRNRSVDEVVKWMMGLYTNSDRTFDPNEFMMFVRDEVLPNIEDRAVRDRLLRQTVQYAKGRHLADETTASTAHVLPRKSKG